MTNQEAIEILEQLGRADGKCVFSQRYALGIAVSALRAMEPTEDEKAHCRNVAGSDHGFTYNLVIEQRALARAQGIVIGRSGNSK